MNKQTELKYESRNVWILSRNIIVIPLNISLGKKKDVNDEKAMWDMKKGE